MLSLAGQLVFDGLTMGLVYVILAAGLVFILSITHTFYIAYGMFYMIGGYVVWYGVYKLHLPFFACLPIGVLIAAILGVLSYILIFQRLQNVEMRFLTTITAAFGLLIMMGSAGMLLFGTIPRGIPTVFPGMLNVFGINIQVDKLVLIGLGIAATLLLFVVYEKTTIGRAMRAVSLLPEVASLQGINTNRIYLVTFGISTALAGFAGGIIAPSYGLHPEMGMNILIPVLLMVMLGGMDSLLGAVAGGLIVGQALSFGQFYIGGLCQLLVFFVIGTIIFFRPNGLLGRRTVFGDLH